MFLRVNTPDASWRGSWFEVLMHSAKKKIMIKMITLDWAQVIVIATFIYQGLGEPICNPVGNFQTLD